MKIADNLYVSNFVQGYSNGKEYIDEKEYCFTCAVKEIIKGIYIQQEIREKPIEYEGCYQEQPCAKCGERYY